MYVFNNLWFHDIVFTRTQPVTRRKRASEGEPPSGLPDQSRRDATRGLRTRRADAVPGGEGEGEDEGDEGEGEGEVEGEDEGDEGVGAEGDGEGDEDVRGEGEGDGEGEGEEEGEGEQEKAQAALDRLGNMKRYSLHGLLGSDLRVVGRVQLLACGFRATREAAAAATTRRGAQQDLAVRLAQQPEVLVLGLVSAL